MSAGLGDGDILFRINSDVSQLTRDFQRLERENQKLKKSLADISKESNRQTKVQTTQAKQMIDWIGRQVVAYTGLHTVIRSVTDAMREQQQLRLGAAGTNRQMAAAQDVFQAAFSQEASTPEGRTRVNALMNRLVGISTHGAIQGPAGLRGASDIAQATSGAFEQRAFITEEMMKRLAPMFSRRPDEFGPFSGGAADLVRQFQRARPNASQKEIGNMIDEVVGLAAATQSQSRLVNVKDFKNFAQGAAATSMVAGGDPIQNVREALILQAAASSVGAEPTGEMVRTAVSNLGPSLRDLMVFNAPPGRRAKYQDATIGELIRGFKTLPEEERFAAARKFKGRSYMRQLLRGLGGETGIDALFDEYLVVEEQIKRGSDPKAYMEWVTKGTPEGRTTYAANVREAVTTEQTRRRRASAGEIEMGLFGGGEGPGAFPATARGFQSGIYRPITRAAFDIALAEGKSPEEAAEIAIQVETYGRRMGHRGPIGATLGLFGMDVTPGVDEEMRQVRKSMAELLNATREAQAEQNANVQSAVSSQQSMHNRPDR